MRLAALALLAFVSAAPLAATDPAGLEVERATLRMRPGDHHWQEAGDAATPVSVVISVPMQMAFVYRGDVLIAASTVSTGKPGKMTPTGEYTILQKRPFHRSNLYNNAPMPWMQRLTWGGIALHGGALPGFPASHGCIRLPTAFAKRLFAATALGGSVAVVNRALPFPALRGGDAVPVLRAEVPQAGVDDAVTGGGLRMPRFAPARSIVQRVPRDG